MTPLSLRSPRWSELNTSYGSAEDLPEMLLACLEDQSDEAWEELYNEVNHQQTVSNAGLAIVPHLVAQFDELRPRGVDTVLGIVTAYIEQGAPSPETPEVIEPLLEAIEWLQEERGEALRMLVQAREPGHREVVAQEVEAVLGFKTRRE